MQGQIESKENSGSARGSRGGGLIWREYLIAGVNNGHGCARTAAFDRALESGPAVEALDDGRAGGANCL